jgi:ribosomal protein S18 acetylase RimI-like enzyme
MVSESFDEGEIDDNQGVLKTNEQIEIRSLDGVALEMLHQSQTKAFSDYPVDVRMSTEQLDQLLRQNSVLLSCSVGAFAGRQLVGFWLNGIRQINEHSSAYDSGTAIWPEYRERGLSSRMWRKTRELLAAHNVGQYWLEVLQNNERAYAIYRRNSFDEKRELRCLKTDNASFGKVRSDVKVRFEQGDFNPKHLSSFPQMEYRPSWQNAAESMFNIQEHVHAVLAKRAGQLVGYGLLLKGTGRITQFGFAAGHWQVTVTMPLMQRLCAASEKKEIFAINVDADAEKSLALLLDCGFTDEFGQYEMVMELS